MEQEKQLLETLISNMGFEDFSVTPSQDSRRLLVFINDAPFLSHNLSGFVSDLDFIFKSILHKRGHDLVFVDINNYRKEREDIIIKLARAAAKKSAVTRKEIALPTMNSFERRIVHTELAMNPDIETESSGEGKARHVVIKPID